MHDCLWSIPSDFSSDQRKDVRQSLARNQNGPQDMPLEQVVISETAAHGNIGRSRSDFEAVTRGRQREAFEGSPAQGEDRPLVPNVGPSIGRRDVPDVRLVLVVEPDVYERSPEFWMPFQFASVGRVELPGHGDVRRFLYEELEAWRETRQWVLEFLLVFDVDDKVEVVVPGYAAVVTQGPDEGSAGHEVSHIRPFDALDESREGEVQEVAILGCHRRQELDFYGGPEVDIEEEEERVQQKDNAVEDCDISKRETAKQISARSHLSTKAYMTSIIGL